MKNEVKNGITISSIIVTSILFLLGTFFLLRSCHAHAYVGYEREMIPNSQIEISYFNHDKKLTDKERAYYEKKREFHKENAERTFKNAKNACWYLPRISDREKARTCYQAAAGTVFTSTPQSKIIIVLTTLLIEYGLDAMREWDYIEDQLHWCQHHSEMYEFFCEVLVKA